MRWLLNNLGFQLSTLLEVLDKDGEENVIVEFKVHLADHILVLGAPLSGLPDSAGSPILDPLHDELLPLDCVTIKKHLCTYFILYLSLIIPCSRHKVPLVSLCSEDIL